MLITFIKSNGNSIVHQNGRAIETDRHMDLNFGIVLLFSFTFTFSVTDELYAKIQGMPSSLPSSKLLVSKFSP